jgi:hypothetical protein
VLRWVLVLFTGLVLLGSQVTSWAAAGIIGDTECCCPVKTECRRHDHDDDRPAGAVLKKCGGQAELVAPVVVHAIAPQAPAIRAVAQGIAAAIHPISPLPESFAREPETPPF